MLKLLAELFPLHSTSVGDAHGGSTDAMGTFFDFLTTQRQPAVRLLFCEWFQLLATVRDDNAGSDCLDRDRRGACVIQEPNGFIAFGRKT
jgi:hypothetical protein